MDRIAIAGFSLHRTDVGALASVRRPTGVALDRFVRNLSDELGASELVYLATCNRVEVIFAREEGAAPCAADLQRLGGVLALKEDGAAMVSELLELRTGREAIRHLFRVTSSLDSLMLGEDQIISQVRRAYGQAADAGLVGTLLGPLFHHALQVGKAVRSETDLARHPVSVVNLAVAALAERAALGHQAVAVVGAGEMGKLVVRALHEAGHTPKWVVNRSLAPAAAVAKTCAARPMTLAEFVAELPAVDVLVSATSAPGLVLEPEVLLALAQKAPCGQGLQAIDLAVPRDLPDMASPDVTVLSLDELRSLADAHRALRAAAAEDAELLVEKKIETYTRRFREDVVAPVLSDLREASEELLVRELNGLLGGRLAHLGDEDRRAIERWARKTFGRLMHLPVSAIKRMVAESPGDTGLTDTVEDHLP
ncbi:MAG: glutamyl-tRNA reductase [Pseudohongiellaceae bacterium]|jgi:glutamyl-tRNA reductase